MGETKDLAGRLRRFAEVYAAVGPSSPCAITPAAQADLAVLLVDAAERIEFLESVAGPVSKGIHPFRAAAGQCRRAPPDL